MGYDQWLDSANPDNQRVPCEDCGTADEFEGPQYQMKYGPAIPMNWCHRCGRCPQHCDQVIIGGLCSEERRANEEARAEMEAIQLERYYYASHPVEDY